MFGYACNETPELMPLPIASRTGSSIERQPRLVSKTEVCTWLRPDAKSQVTIEYEERQAGPRRHRGAARRSTRRHARDEEIRKFIVEKIIKPVLPKGLDTSNITYLHQPDRAVRGRRPARRLRPHRPQDHRRHLRRLRRRHGGGAFSGKDPTKVDRSAAYMPRATWPRTSSPPASPTAAKCSSPTRSASASR